MLQTQNTSHTRREETKTDTKHSSDLPMVRVKDQPDKMHKGEKRRGGDRSKSEKGINRKDKESQFRAA